MQHHSFLETYTHNPVYVLPQTNIKAQLSAKKIATREDANQTRGYVTET